MFPGASFTSMLDANCIALVEEYGRPGTVFTLDGAKRVLREHNNVSRIPITELWATIKYGIEYGILRKIEDYGQPMTYAVIV